MKTFLSKNLYGKRPATHFDFHHVQPGWLFIELGSWTLEVEYDEHFLAGAASKLRGLLNPLTTKKNA